MKNARSGMTLVEVSVAAIGLGLLFMTLANVVSASRKGSAQSSLRMSALTDLNDFTNNLSEPEFFRSLALAHPDSEELKKCFEQGCPVDTSGSFALDSEDSRWKLLNPSYSWKVISPGLVLLSIRFPEDKINSSGREVSFYHSRKDFLNTDFRTRESECGDGFNEVPNVVAGIDTRSGIFLCRTQLSGVDIWKNRFLRKAQDVGGQEWK